MKTCNKCRDGKSVAEFSNGQGKCKKCRNLEAKGKPKNPESRLKAVRKYRASHPKETRESQRKSNAKRYAKFTEVEIKAANLQKNYGLSLEDWNQMSAEQGGVCAICSQPPGNKGLCVDHDHNTGAVRGLLCHTCNSAIGLLKDSSSVLFSAYKYLSRYAPVFLNNYASPACKTSVVL